MASPDAYEVLQTALSPLIKGITDSGRYKLEQARLNSERAYNDQRISEQRAYEDSRAREQRDYQEKIEEKRRKEKKDDAAEERIRGLRDELARFLPPGITVDPKLTEEQLSQEIARRSRAQKIEYAKEDVKNAIDNEIQKNKAVSEAKLREEAKTYGVKDSDTAPLDVVNRALSEQKVKTNLEIEAAKQQSTMSAARQTDEFKLGQLRLGKIASDMDAAAASAVPLPELHGISKKDAEAINAETANDPVIAAKIKAMPGGPAKLAALAKGDYQTVVAGMKANDRDALMQDILSRRKDIEENVNARHTLENKGAVAAYWKRVDDVPQVLTRLEKERDSLISDLNKLPLPVGTALRIDDVDGQKALYKKAVLDRGLPAGLSTTDGAAANDGGVTPNQAGLSLPVPGEYAAAPNPNQTAGILPTAGNAIASTARAAAGANNLVGGGRDLTAGISGLMDGVGNSVYNTKTALLGGEFRPEAPGINPLDSYLQMTRGAAQLSMAPAEVLGMGMSASRPFLDRIAAPIRNAGNAVGDWINSKIGPQPVSQNPIVSSDYE